MCNKTFHGICNVFPEVQLHQRIMLLAGLSGLGLLSDGCENIEGKTSHVFVYLEVPNCRV